MFTIFPSRFLQQRYVVALFLRFFIFSLIVFTLFFALGELLEISSTALNKPTDKIYKYLLLSLPQLSLRVLPISLMFSICLAISQLNLNGEIVAIYCSGKSFYQIILFPLLFSVFLGFFQIIAHDYWLFAVQKKANIYKAELLEGTNRFSRKVIRAKNLKGKEGFYYINYFNQKTKKITDGFSYMMIDDNHKPHRFYEAKTASYNREDKIWTLTQARVFYFNTNYELEKIEENPNLLVSLPETPEFFDILSLFPDELTINELWNEIKKQDKRGENPVDYTIALHNKLSLPLTCFLLCFIGAIGGIWGSHRSGSSFMHSLFLCTIMLLIYYISFSISESLAQAGVISGSIASWAPNLFYFGIICFFWYRSV